MQQMHAGEEILYVLIPAFLVLMIIDFTKRRRLRRRQIEEEPNEGDPIDDSQEPPST